MIKLHLGNTNPRSIPSHSNLAMNLIFLAITISQLFLTTEAAPLSRRDDLDECTQPHSTEATWDPVDKYTMKLFQEEATVQPGPTLCLFYTQGLSEKARHYAKSRPNGESLMTTIWVLTHNIPRTLFTPSNAKHRTSGQNTTTTTNPPAPTPSAA
jgi:hypothetical protein